MLAFTVLTNEFTLKVFPVSEVAIECHCVHAVFDCFVVVFHYLFLEQSQSIESKYLHIINTCSWVRCQSLFCGTNESHFIVNMSVPRAHATIECVTHITLNVFLIFKSRFILFYSLTFIFCLKHTCSLINSNTENKEIQN